MKAVTFCQSKVLSLGQSKVLSFRQRTLSNQSEECQQELFVQTALSETAFIWQILAIAPLADSRRICQTSCGVKLRLGLRLTPKMPICLAEKEMQVRFLRVESRCCLQIFRGLHVVGLLRIELAQLFVNTRVMRCDAHSAQQKRLSLREISLMPQHDCQV